MAYAIYYKKPNERTWARAGVLATASKGKLKGTLVHHDIKCDTIEQANSWVDHYRNKGYQTKVKEVK